MRLLDDKKDVKLCVERFESLIASEISMSDLFGVLDSVIFDYMNYALEEGLDPDLTSENLFYLKKTRNLFIEMSSNNKPQSHENITNQGFNK